MTPVTVEDSQLATPGAARAAVGRRGFRERARLAARVAALAIAAIAIQFVMVTTYAWSAASTAPRNVPVAITGSARQVAAVTGEIDLNRPGALRLIPAPSRDQATADITGRRAYGAIVLRSAHAPVMLVASGASPAVANALTNLASHLNGSRTSPGGTHAIAVRDIVPSSPSDPTAPASRPRSSSSR